MSLKTNSNGAPKSGVVTVKIECSMPIGGALDLFNAANSVSYLEVTPHGKPPVVLMDAQKVKSKAGKTKKRRKSKTTDARAAWRKDRKQGRMVLNVSETLKNIGMSERKLMATPTKMGTLEHSLKRTVLQKRACAAR